jgi:hypothetical protein
MKGIRIAALSFCLGLLSLPFVQKAHADEWDKKTNVTFNEPVEVPGVVLPAGSYVFKLADSESDRHIVQILSKDQKHVYATILAISDERLEPTGKTVITFEERTKDAPEALKAWFYPGDNIGVRFVYPKQRAMEIARNTNETVPAMTSSAAASQSAKPAPAVPTPVASTNSQPQVTALKQEPVKAATPEGNLEGYEVAMAKANPPARRPHHLPKTASDLPLLLVLGCTSLLSILPVRLALRSRGSE